MTKRQRSSWSKEDWLICVILLIVTLSLYADVRHFEFVDYDDGDYATAPQLRKGITLSAIRWAFTSGDAANWLPLTRLSHLLDYQLFGPASGPAHIVNVVIHTLASVMLFAFLRRATGARWKSAFVAFVFAWHPLHVDSVAWVSERKDVLCAFFWFLCMWLWVRQRYSLALLAFALGLMSKPMIVTLPVVLLLIGSRRVLREVAPMFGLSALASFITIAVQRSGGAVSALTVIPFSFRIENALVTVAIYIGKMFWPSNLAFWYPFHATTPLWLAIICGVVIAAATIMALRSLHTWFAIGWLWFIVTLLPVIGLIQVGAQARADRYMYVPMVGLLIVLVWGAEAIITRLPGTKQGIVALGILACAILLPVSWLQIQTWHNSQVLFRRGIEVNHGDCLPAWFNLGTLALHTGKPDEAVTDLQQALTLSPNDATARGNLGVAISQMGNWSEAILQLENAVALDPGSATYTRNLGMALLQTGRFTQAIRILETIPNDARAKELLAIARAKSGHQ